MFVSCSVYSWTCASEPPSEPSEARRARRHLRLHFDQHHPRKTKLSFTPPVRSAHPLSPKVVLSALVLTTPSTWDKTKFHTASSLTPSPLVKLSSSLFIPTTPSTWDRTKFHTASSLTPPLLSESFPLSLFMSTIPSTWDKTKFHTARALASPPLTMLEVVAQAAQPSGTTQQVSLNIVLGGLGPGKEEQFKTHAS